jgi:hypothetical protein
MSDTVSDDVGRAESGAWLPLEDAARFLRVTVRTIDRRGLPKRKLPGQTTEVWVVGADAPVSDVSETSDGHIGHDNERAIALSERVSDVVGRQLAPLLAALERQAERIEDLARENDKLTVELDLLKVAQALPASNLAPASPDPSTEPPEPASPFPRPIPPQPNLRALAPWLLLAVILGAAGWYGGWPW